MMKRSNQLCHAVLFAIALYPFFTRTLVASPVQIEGQAVGDAFREFYEALLPNLQKNYCNVSYRSAAVERMPVFYSGGVIGEGEFLEESSLGNWLSKSGDQVTLKLVKEYDPNDRLKVANAQITRGESCWSIMMSKSRKPGVSRKERRGSYYGVFGSAVPILSPTWSVASFRPNARFWGYPDNRFVDFKDGPSCGSLDRRACQNESSPAK